MLIQEHGCIPLLSTKSTVLLEKKKRNHVMKLFRLSHRDFETPSSHPSFDVRLWGEDLADAEVREVLDNLRSLLEILLDNDGSGL